ncbi:MAG: cupin domain-containing protein [Marinifilaceae bacterium]|nr:cupin domain-containing protein [Marinifilaceae bacterium]
MKNLLFIPVMIICSLAYGQGTKTSNESEKILVDNDKLKVVEFVSNPEGNVCGIGIHHHEPHLTIALTDAKVRITPENGEPKELEVKSGTSIWFDTDETHSVVNSGDNPVKMILVYLKE